MREVSKLDLPDREGVERRIREAVRNLDPELRMDELELTHLTDIVTNHALLLNDLYSGRRLDQIMGQEPSAVFHSISELSRREDEIPADAIHQIRSIPDDVRVVGDKCLYDVGLFGRQDYQGLDLRQLGVRCYHLASDLLQHLADDRRLRDYFRQNRMGPMPIEEEVVFLKQCASRFGVYANLLRGLKIFEPIGSSSAGSSVSAPALTRPSPSPPLTPPLDPDVLIDDAVPPRETRGSSKAPFAERADPRSSQVLGADALPRRDLLSLYERLVLFSNLDVPALRAELNRVVVDQPDAVSALCDELSLYATGTQNLNRPASFFLVGPTGVGKNHLAECLVRALQGKWGIEVPFLL